MQVPFPIRRHCPSCRNHELKWHGSGLRRGAAVLIETEDCLTVHFNSADAWCPNLSKPMQLMTGTGPPCDSVHAEKATAPPGKLGGKAPNCEHG